MWLLKLIVFALGVLLIWAGLPAFGGGLVFSVALNEFCNEFGRGHRE